MKHSSIVIGGVSALYLNDWTDLVPANMEFIVDKGCVDTLTVENIPESRFFERDPLYFDAFIRPNCVRLENNPIPVLDPAWALADAWRSGEWRPGPDDLDCDDILAAGGLDEISKAFTALEIELPDFLNDRNRCGARTRR